MSSPNLVQIDPQTFENIYLSVFWCTLKRTKIINNSAVHIPTILKFGMLVCQEIKQTGNFDNPLLYKTKMTDS